MANRGFVGDVEAAGDAFGTIETGALVNGITGVAEGIEVARGTGMFMEGVVLP